MNTRSARLELKKLSWAINARQWGEAGAWSGAGVVITNHSPAKNSKDFYPAPRNVVTKNVHELSWIFEKSRDIFLKFEDYGLWKEEIFGRLANMANGVLEKNPKTELKELLFSIIHEDYSILDEIRENKFRILMISSGGKILNDLLKEVDEKGYLSAEESKAYFARLKSED